MPQSNPANAPLCQLPRRPLYAIEFPGYVKNVVRAMAMLGGINKVEKSFNNELENIIEFWYRPEDPFSHALVGQINKTNSLVLKVQKKRRKDSPEVTKQTATIVGLLKKTGHFKVLADYQFIPDAAAGSTKMRDAFNQLNLEAILPFNPLQKSVVSLRPNDSQLANQEEIDPSKEPFNLIPPAFSRLERPLEYNFRQSTAVRQVVVRDVDSASTTVKLVPTFKTRKFIAHGIDYSSTTVPSTPPSQALAHAHIFISHVNNVRRCFEQRPVWTRQALLMQLSAEDQKLFKKTIPLVAYYFSTGPWRACWVKYGFDPRTSPSSRFYQLLDLRKSEETKKTLKRLVKKEEDPIESLLRRTEEKIEHSESRSHVLTTTTPMDQYQSMYQLCDLRVPDLQKIVYSEKEIKTVCDEKDGWYPKGTIDILRQMVKSKRTDSHSQWHPTNREEIEEQGMEQGPLVSRVDTLMKQMLPTEEERQMMYNEEEAIAYDVFGEEEDE